MATTIGTAYVQILPTTEGITQNLTGMLSGPSQTAGESSGRTLGAGMAKGLKVASVAVGAATTAVSALAGAAVKAGSSYETAFAQVQTIMDTSQVSTEEMSSAILSLSNDMGIAAGELSGTVYNAISATGDTANAVTLAGQASKLATAGFTDTGSALSVLTTAMNAYGLSADEAEHISDSLIQVQNLGVTTVSELASSMGKAIASASAYGVDLTNLESAYVSMTKAGINTAESTTYISSMLKELGSSGSKVSTILQEQTGKSFDQLMAEGMSLGDVLGILYESADGDATALMNLWSSAEAGKASNAIISQGLEEFNQNLKAIGESSETTQTAFDTMQDTLEKKAERFKTIGTNMLTAVYEGMSDKLGMIADFGISSMQTLSDAMEEGGISGVISALGTVLSEGIALLIGELPQFVDAGMELLSSLVNGIVDNLPAIADAAIRVIATLTEGLSESLPELIPKCVDIITTIVRGLIENLPALVQAAIQLIGGLTMGLIQAIPELITAIPEIISALVSALVNGVPEMLDAGWELMRGLGQGILEGFASIWDMVKENANGLINGVKNLFGIHSPSTVFRDQVGRQLMAGMAEGIAGNEDMVANALGDVSAFAEEEAALTMNGRNYRAAEQASEGDLAAVLNRLTLILNDLRDNGIEARAYMDGRAVSDSVTRYQRQAMRAGSM